MISIAIIDLMSFCFIITSVILLAYHFIRKRHLSNNIMFSVLGLLFIFILHHISNLFQWLNISDAFVPFEPYLEIFFPIFWFAIFFFYVRDTRENQIAQNQKEIEEAYIYSELYKDLFVHDIRNILQNISSANELLSIYTEDAQSKDLFELLEITQNQVRRGMELINNVQKLFDIRHKNTELSKVDIFEYLEKAINHIKKSYASSKNIEIKLKKLDDHFYVAGNKHLQDIFENLLHNAIIHNKNDIKRIRIKISNEFLYEGINYIKIELLDNGIGIPDRKKNYIFQRISKQSVIGMGLGLSLVKSLIESFKGKIWVENRVKDDYTQGSNFIVLFVDLINQKNRIEGIFPAELF